eukprot:GSChrysophyteH1.ASY1.ANO1.283.1 assembled CDS
MLACQRDKFGIEKDVTYLNCAAYSPLLLASKESGIDGINLKMNPYVITPDHHFAGHARLRYKIAQFLHLGNDYDEALLQIEADRIATFPSVSYGLAIVAKNLHRLRTISSKRDIVTVYEEFPNDTYAFGPVAQELGLKVIAVPDAEEGLEKKGQQWNQKILDAITEGTALVVLPHVHWMYGVVFQLELIAAKCRECGALLAIDGSQSIGALPLDLETVRPDALIVAAYKWMLGPYSISFGYFGSFFDDGVPLEETWMNRVNSANFSNLMQHTSEYRPLAQRYNMGEFSEFIHAPMLEASVDHLLACGGAGPISEYIKKLSDDAVQRMRELGIVFVEDAYRSPHLLGAYLPVDCGLNAAVVASTLKEMRVYLSVRGSALRISINTFNDTSDVDRMLTALERALRGNEGNV